MTDDSKTKFELKPRSNAHRRTNKNDDDKLVRKMTTLSVRIVVCSLLLIGTVFLKMIGTPFAVSTLSTAEEFLTEQTDFTQLSEGVISYIVQTSEALLGEDVSLASANTNELNPPIKEGIVKEAFVPTSHPVYNTVINPTAIIIECGEELGVYGVCDSVVGEVIINSDDSIRLITKVDKKTTIVYDNLKYCTKRIGDKIISNEEIGKLSEEDRLLSFEVWVDNEAIDPQKYINFQSVSDAKK